MSTAPTYLALRTQTRPEGVSRIFGSIGVWPGANGSAGGWLTPRAGGMVPWRVLVLAAALLLTLGLAAALALTLGPAPDAGTGGRGSVGSASVRSHRDSSRAGLLSLPLTAQAPVSAALGGDSAAYRVSAYRGGLRATNPAQRLSASFGSSGVYVASGATTVGLSLRAVGYGASLSSLTAVAPQVQANRVVYAQPGLNEWYANGPLGLEQGFTIARAPAGQPTGPLTLSIALSGNAHASLAKDGQSITLSRSGEPALRYSGLSASDARRRVLHSWLQLRAGRILLRVDARGARYPLRIDPLVQQSETLTGGGEAGDGAFGYSTALSADGNTALIGGPTDRGHVGAAWVFTRSGSTWTQQGEKLTGGGEVGKARFGRSVALSADGNTALIGGGGDESASGAAWVFTRSGSTWTQQALLTGGGESGAGRFGVSVALSADGNTALIGGPAETSGVGAAWAFTRSGSEWTQQGEKLTGGGESGEGEFGYSVALSADGNTALIGGAGDNGGRGAAWVFTRSGSGWTQQGEKLTGAEESGKGVFGYSVALSAEGNTALIGGPHDDKSVGAAWVFTRSGSEWTQQGEKLTGGGESGAGRFGSSVALSADGDSALIGGPYDNSRVGAVWLFKRSGSVWGQQGEKLSGSGEVGADTAAFGSSVALSSQATTALIGAHADNGSVGAAWVFVPAPPPEVTGVSPGGGPKAGGTEVTITGSRFAAGATVSFGANAASSVKLNSANSITATAPPGSGTVNVTVTTSDGTSEETPADLFSYVPPGQLGSLDVTRYCERLGDDGTGAGPAILTKGASTGPDYAYENWACVEGDGHVVPVATTGPAPSMSGACVLEYPGVASLAYPNDANDAKTWSCYRGPQVVSVKPSSGLSTGGTMVTITGSGFFAGATVRIGGEATNVHVVSEDELTATTLATSAGPYEVVVRDEENGTSTGGPSFTYVNPPCSGSPVLEAQPVGQTVRAPGEASFTVKEGAVPKYCSAASIQWQVSTDSGLTWSSVSGANISGATSATLSIDPTNTSESGNEYRALLSNGHGETESDAATLTVNPPFTKPTVTEPPTSDTVTAGEAASFTAEASGNPTPTVQWEVSVDGGPFEPVPGATSDALELPSTSTRESGDRYEAVFTNSQGEATTESALLTVKPPPCSAVPSIGEAPANDTVTAPAAASFTVREGAVPKYCSAASIQWQVSTDSGLIWSSVAGANVSGATSAKLSIDPTSTSESSNEYRAALSNGRGETDSAPALLTVNPALAPVFPEAKSGVLGSVSVALPAPQLAVTGNLAPVSGRALVRLPGSTTFVALTTARQVPFGTVVNATSGTVTVTTVGAHDEAQMMTFYQGEFKFTQGHSGVVVATLKGGNFSVCPTRRKRKRLANHLARASSKHASGKHVVRKLWADGHGSYSTKGSYAAGAVLGTVWLTEDLCEGTLIHVVTDSVAVTNLVTHRHVTVRAGHSYLAKAP